MTKKINFRSLLKTVICLAFFIGCTTSAVFACSCIPRANKSFFESSSRADLIIVGKATSYEGAGASPNTPLALGIEVQRVLKGNAALQKVQIVNGAESLCRLNVANFPLNTNWVFNLNLSSIGADGVPQYYISICEVALLQVKAGNVFGRIKSDQQTSMPLTRFLKSLRR